MSERTNRRDLMVQTAAELFINQGYAATSIRQIANAVGCTEAALYYHFKDGKRGLLQAVIESKTPDLVSVLNTCQQATSLSQLILEFGRCMTQHCEVRERIIQWLISEYPNLSPDEQALFHQKHLMFHAELAKLLLPFVPDEREAETLAWILACTVFGYRQIFITLGLGSLADFPMENFTEKIAHYMAK